MKTQKIQFSWQGHEDVAKELERELDQTTIDYNENIALRLADKLDMFNPGKSMELEQSAYNGSLDDGSITAIKELQKRLKEDGKYAGAIDGIAGRNTRKGLADLVLENVPALIKDSNTINETEGIERIKGNVPKGMER